MMIIKRYVFVSLICLILFELPLKAQTFEGSDKVHAVVPMLPAQGYVITNNGDSIPGSITGFNRQGSYFLVSVTLNGNSYSAEQCKGFGFYAWYESLGEMRQGQGDWWTTMPHSNIKMKREPAVIVYESVNDPNPKKVRKLFLWKTFDKNGLTLYQSSKIGIGYIKESGSTTRKMTGYKVNVNEDALNLVDSTTFDADYRALNEYKKKNPQSLFEGQAYYETTVKGLAEYWYYGNYQLKMTDGSLTEINGKNYQSHWEYMFKGCPIMAEHFADKDNQKWHRFTDALAIFATSCY